VEQVTNIPNMQDIQTVRGGADKSLARPVMKQATVTKFGVNSTNSP